MSDEFIEIEEIGSDKRVRKERLKSIGMGIKSSAKIIGKEFVDTGKKTFKALSGKKTLEELKAEEQLLKGKLSVQRKKEEIRRLKRKVGGGGFGKFRDLATELSNTKLGQGGLGDEFAGFGPPVVKRRKPVKRKKRVTKRKVKRKKK